MTVEEELRCHVVGCQKKPYAAGSCYRHYVPQRRLRIQVQPRPLAETRPCVLDKTHISAAICWLCEPDGRPWWREALDRKESGIMKSGETI